MTTTPATILNDAATELETNGWCRKHYVDAQGRHCALGAIYTVAPGCGVRNANEADTSEVAREAVLALAEEVAPGTDFDILPNVTVFDWNDRQRDRRKVVRALRRTARKLTAKETA